MAQVAETHMAYTGYTDDLKFALTIFKHYMKYSILRLFAEISV